MPTITPSAATGEKIQPGEYEATITGFKDEGMSDGKYGEPQQRWLVKMKIDACVDCYDENNPGACDGKVGQEHFQWMNESSNPKSTMYKIVKAAGEDPKGFDTDDCVGKRIKITYDYDEIQGKQVLVVTQARPLRGKKAADETPVF